jgi:hypothetical protein
VFLLLGQASCGVTRKEDCDVTSCASCPGYNAWYEALPVPPPDKPKILQDYTTVVVGGGGGLGVCFFRDEERAAEAQAITWTSLDPAIATVSPNTGPKTIMWACP